jgi:hypothetical protein
MHRLLQWLNRPVDASSMAVFRIGFGAVMLWEAITYIVKGHVEYFFVEPTFHFSYYGFEWVQPLGRAGMYTVFFALAIAACALMAGWKYRIAAFVVWLCFTYQFLIEQARYLNHFYAASLFALFLVFIPANAAWSMDRRLAPTKKERPTIPAWALWLIRFQTGVIYFYAGVAKLDGDWLRGEPIVAWMRNRMGNPFVKAVFDLGLELPVFAWGGLLVDLLMFPALLWKRTRWFAFGAAVLFHLWNSTLFQIGIFPPMMIVATAMFFEPDWPRRLLAKLRRSAFVPSTALALPPRQLGTVGLSVLLAFAAVQLLLPLRHHLYPGDVAWTEEGHRFAWRMMLRAKTGHADFVLVDDGAIIDVDVDRYLASWQQLAMGPRPDMLQQFAHYLADEHQQKTGRRPKVYANSAVSLNHRERKLLLAENVDLAATSRSLAPKDWIAPAP